MSVHRKDSRWVVRWREEGRQRSKSFATKREAVEADRAQQREGWRETVALPVGAVPARSVDRCTSFVVAEDIYVDAPSGFETREQRGIHDGFFLRIADADAYRRKMPDADALSIAVLFDRFPRRDLTEDEIAAGEFRPTDDDERFMQQVREVR